MLNASIIEAEESQGPSEASTMLQRPGSMCQRRHAIQGHIKSSRIQVGKSDKVQCSVYMRAGLIQQI